MKGRPVKAGSGFADWVNRLSGKSGVYVIRSNWGKYLYIGESHSGRLAKTLKRHFYPWKGPTSGPTYDPEDVLVSVRVVRASQAVALQDRMICKHKPRDNRLTRCAEEPF